MGQAFRRFWLPALPASQVATPGGVPVRLRLLGENLVAFRDTNNRVGIVTPRCAHRGASLFLGRNEDGGLRCIYHGWKYDIHGKCLEIPNLPSDQKLRDEVRITAYPAREAGGVIWVYMGPPSEMPELPRFEWMRVPESHRTATVWLQETNWLQGME